MSNEAVFRCATDPTVERFVCCGSPTSAGPCTCGEGSPSAAQRQRNAAMKTTNAGESHEYRVGERTFPLTPLPAPDPFEATIAARRARQARLDAARRPAPTGRAGLPADYRPDGPPPDPYAARIEALRQEVA